MLKTQLIGVIIAGSLVFPSSILALDIPNNRLLDKTLTVKVAPGKVTAIHFTTGEKIIHYQVSDETKLIHNLDAPKGEATTFMLREIKEDPMYGATRSSIPNLLITTRFPDGSTQLYEFLITFEKQISEPERVIRVTNPAYRLADQRLFTPNGQVTLEDVQAGLNHVLSTQQAYSSEPIVQQIRHFLALATQMPLDKALTTSQVDVEAIKRLGEIGNKVNGKSL